MKDSSHNVAVWFLNRDSTLEPFSTRSLEPKQPVVSQELFNISDRLREFKAQENICSLKLIADLRDSSDETASDSDNRSINTPVDNLIPKMIQKSDQAMCGNRPS